MISFYIVRFVRNTRLMFAKHTMVVIVLMLVPAPSMAFDPGAGANDDIYAVAVQPNGKILVGGDFTTLGGALHNRIARLNHDGSVDQSFNAGGGPDGTVRSIAVLSNGQILIGGDFETIGNRNHARIARLFSNGGIDTSFRISNIIGQTNGSVFSIALQPDGKVVLGGTFTILVHTERNLIVRLNTDGTVDESFDPGAGATGSVQSVVLQPDGKILIAGGFGMVSNHTRNGIARLHSDSSIDLSFKTGTGTDGNVYAMALQANDGKILIGGAFSNVRGNSRNHIARLNADSSVDQSFNPGSGTNETVRSIAVDADGKIVIGGWFTVVRGNDLNRIARFTSNASVDQTFDVGSGADSFVEVVSIQPNGRILIGGQFSHVNGVSLNKISRLNQDGTLDTGDPDDETLCLPIQTSGGSLAVVCL